eukprot:scaffold105075_cov69-Phaeocystis_antarctica.AAC.1
MSLALRYERGAPQRAVGVPAAQQPAPPGGDRVARRDASGWNGVWARARVQAGVSVACIALVGSKLKGSPPPSGLSACLGKVGAWVHGNARR